MQANSKDKHHATGYGGGANAAESLPKTVDGSSKEVKEAISKVTSHKDPSNWLILGLEGGPELKVVAVGTSGLEGLKTHLAAAPGKVFFGIFLVIGSSEDGGCISRNDKLVYFSYVGQAVAEMVRAQASVLKRPAQNIFGSTSLSWDIDGSAMQLMTANTVGFKLMHGSGSHKSSHFDFGGPGGKIETKAFTHEDEEHESDEDFD